MKFPFIKFFPTDWLAESSLRACGLAARGLWIDMLSLMHMAPRRGYLLAATGSPISPEQLARMTGCSADEVNRLLEELRTSGAFSCTVDGTIYCRRMVREESKRNLCQEAGRLGGNPLLTGKSDATLKGGVKGGVKGVVKGRANPLDARGQTLETKEPPTPSGGGVVAEDDPPEEVVDAVGMVIRPEPFSQLIAAWVAAKLPGWNSPDGIRGNGNRRGAFQQRQRDPYWRDRWRAAVDRLGKSKRARGETPSWPQGIRLDGFLKDPAYIDRALEGEFDDTPGAGGQPVAPPRKITTREELDAADMRISPPKPLFAGGSHRVG